MTLVGLSHNIRPDLQLFVRDVVKDIFIEAEHLEGVRVVEFEVLEEVGETRNLVVRDVQFAERLTSHERAHLTDGTVSRSKYLQQRAKA